MVLGFAFTDGIDVVLSFSLFSTFRVDQATNPNEITRFKTSYFTFAACFSFLMSSLTILSMACMTRCDFAASLSLNNSLKTVGTICHDRPYLSWSQPHCTSLPPAESLRQN